MKERPKLVNPQKWTPFKPIPTPKLPPVTEPLSYPVSIEPIPLTRRDIIKRNSIFLNVMAIIILILLGYFLYGIYLERKILSEYLGFIQSQKEPPGPTPSGHNIWK